MALMKQHADELTEMIQKNTDSIPLEILRGLEIKQNCFGMMQSGF